MYSSRLHSYLQVVPLLLSLVTWQSFASSGSGWDVNTDDDSDCSKDIHYLKQMFRLLAREVMMQQFSTREKIRTDGDSGIKQIRMRNVGTKNYFSDSHTGRSVAAIHDHSNNIRTVGLGQFVGVLNGVEFRTRHNDYALVMPHRTSKEWHATEPIPFPEVPPEVSNQPTIVDQIAEMREWFRAWGTQNITHRDYRKYFKPILCYLEGAWTKSTHQMEEPFKSDRHFIDAKNWHDLQQRIRFSSYTGSKNRLENLAFLPTTLLDFVNDQPVFAQWNYRIICHPLGKDLPLNRFRPVDDLANRMMAKTPMDEYVKSKAARFVLNSNDSDTFYNQPTSYGFLDTLMEQIPGKDNYPGSMTDSGLDGDDQVRDVDGQTAKDVSRYHRWYKMGKKDAMGLRMVKRAYSDSTVFMAKTEQHNVVELSVEDRTVCGLHNKDKTCHDHIHQKWSYAIPLEIIYQTPLSSWNPYNLPYYGDAKSQDGKGVKANKRNGDCFSGSGERAYNGTNSKVYYLTPSEFFNGKEHERDPADTSRGDTCVLDKGGNVRKVRSSGVRIFFPEIKGVGVLRQRWPIMPVHGEGSSVWKELNAHKDAMRHREKYTDILSEEVTQKPKVNVPPPVSFVELTTRQPNFHSVRSHFHTIMLDYNLLKKLHNGELTRVSTSVDHGHAHSMVLAYNKEWKFYFYTECDGQITCKDGHPRVLDNLVNDNLTN